MADPIDQLITDLDNGNVFGGAPSGGTDSGLTRTNAVGPMPADWENLIQESAKNYGVPPTLLKAVLQQESGFNSSAIGKAVKNKKTGKISYAQGVAQFMPDTAQELGVKDPFDPGEAIPKQAKYLRQLLDNNKGDISKALNIYSGGMGAPYVKQVYDKYQKLGGDPQQFVPMVPDKIPASVPALAPGATPGGDTKSELFGDILDGLQPPASASAAPVVTPPHEFTNPVGGIVGNLPPGKTSDISTGVLEPVTEGVGPRGTTWGTGQNIASGAIFGFGPEVSAAAGVTKNAISDLAGGHPMDALRDFGYYGATEADYEAAKKNYQEKNPQGSVAGDVVGSTATTLPVLGAAGKGLGLAGRELATQFPETAKILAPAARFLAGEAGAGAGGGLMARAGQKALQVSSRAANAALEGAGAGAINSKTTGGNPITNAITGAEVGGPIGALAATAGSLFKRFAPEVNPEVANLVTRLQRLGIDIHPNQFVKDGPGAALGPVVGDETQLAQHTAAVAKTMGSTATKLTPQAMSDAADATANSLEDAAKHTSINAVDLIGAPGQLGPLSKIEKDAMAELPTHGQALPYIRQQVSNILNEVGQTGFITGDVYQSLTRYNGAIGRMIRNTDPDISNYGIKLRGALDDALEANAPPGMVNQVKTARSNWKNMLIAERALNGTPGGTTTGIISPNAYQAAVKKFNKDFAYQAGGDVNDIARSAPHVPEPTAVGGVQPPKGAVKAAVQAMWSHPVKTLAGIGGLAAIAGDAAPILGAIGEHPAIASSLGVPALLAAGGRKLYQALGNTQAYKNMLLRNAGATPPRSVGEAALRGIRGIPRVIVPAAVTATNRQ